MQKDVNLEAADSLYLDLATENFQVYHRAEHKWYYLSSQTPSELIVFKQADSWGDKNRGISGYLKSIAHILIEAGVPHCSFYNPHVSPLECPRESIEARAFVYYHE